MAMHCIGKDVRRRPRIESTRPAVGQIGSPGALRHLPDAKASRYAPRLPGKPICSHQIDSYLPGTALEDFGGGAVIGENDLNDFRKRRIAAHP